MNPPTRTRRKSWVVIVFCVAPLLLTSCGNQYDPSDAEMWRKSFKSDLVQQSKCSALFDVSALLYYSPELAEITQKLQLIADHKDSVSDYDWKEFDTDIRELITTLNSTQQSTSVDQAFLDWKPALEKVGIKWCYEFDEPSEPTPTPKKTVTPSPIKSPKLETLKEIQEYRDGLGEGAQAAFNGFAEGKIDETSASLLNYCENQVRYKFWWPENRRLGFLEGCTQTNK